MNEIYERRRTEIGRTGIQFVLVVPNDLGGEVADVLELFGVAREESGIGFFAADVNDIAYDFFFLPFSISSQRDFYVSLRNVHRIGARIEYERLPTADFIGHYGVGDAVIVFAYAAVHHHHNNVGFGCPAHNGHDSASGFHAVAKVKVFPELFGKPLWDGGGDHAEHTDAHAVYLLLYIGREIKFVLALVDHVGSQHRKPAVVHPTVVDGVSGFDVVIAQCSAEIPHIVEHASAKMCGSGVDVIVIVGRRLALQYISVVDEQYAPFALFGTQTFHVGGDAAQATFPGFIVDEVVGKVVAVYV